MGTKLHLLTVTVGIALALLGGPVSAQVGTPGATPTVAPIGILGTVQVDALPSPHAEVWFIRFTLSPRGSLPLDQQIGPTVAIVESGALVFMTDRPVTVNGGLPQHVATPDVQGVRETVVMAGQTVSVAENTVLGVRNDARVPAVFLALFIFSPQRETEAMQQADAAATAGGAPAEPIGLSQQPLGITSASFPAGPGVVTIERIDLAAGAAELTNVADGSVVGGVERGDVTITLDSGGCHIWPGILQPGNGDVRNVRIGPGQPRELTANDGFGCWDGAIQWKAGAAGATILRARVEPAGAGPAATPVS